MKRMFELASYNSIAHAHQAKIKRSMMSEDLGVLGESISNRCVQILGPLVAADYPMLVATNHHLKEQLKLIVVVLYIFMTTPGSHHIL